MGRLDSLINLLPRKLQGNNYCKQLGLKPSKQITSKDFERIWKKYNEENKHDNYAAKEGMDKRAAKKFLKHFAALVGEEYEESKAERLIRDCDELNTGYINYDQFKKLFFQAATSTNRINLSQSLKTKLSHRSTIWTSRALRMTSSSGTDAESITEELEAMAAHEDVDDQYFFLDAPQRTRKCPFHIVGQNELEQIIQSMQEEVGKVVGLSSEDAGLLLHFFHWDKEKLYARYFDDQDKHLIAAGLMQKDASHVPRSPVILSMSPPNSPGKQANADQEDDPESGDKEEEETFECPVCCDEIPLSSSFALPGCGHRFCMECWGGHLKSNAHSYGTQIVSKTRCMHQGCNLLINREHFRLLADQDSWKRYQYFYVKGFVENHKKFTFCPADCGHAVNLVDAQSSSMRPSSSSRHSSLREEEEEEETAAHEGNKAGRDVVECLCGKKFCFECGLEYHNPVNCKQMKEWCARNDDDKDSLKLIMAIAKPCPQCGIPIDRTDGCNHMTCQKCSHEWCWQCRGPWKEHGDRTGGFYFCNHYESSDAHKMDQEADHVREEHNRFLHYFNGFHVNDKDEKGTVETLKPTLLENASRYKELTGGDPGFLADALDTLIESRHVLKQSYIYAYFLPPHDSPQKKVFEMQQAYAQNICERLAKELMESIEKLDRNKVVYLHKACRQYFENLVDFFESPNGQALYAMMPRERKSKSKEKKSQTSWWICSKCTFGNPAVLHECELCGTRRGTEYL